MRRVNRVVGAISRRTGRPELLAAVSADARQLQMEAIGIEAILASALRADSVYVDVGANRGQILSEALRMSPQGRCIAFEPIPALAAEVRRAFPQVDCREIALGSRPQVAEFCYFRTMDGWSGLRRSPLISDQRGDPEYITVQVSTLDAELEGVSPSIVKIDVEGAELAVLEGGRSLLSRARPLVIFEHVTSASDLYGAPADGPWELLTDLGYRIYSVTGAGPVTRADFAANTTVVNWLGTPSLA